MTLQDAVAIDGPAGAGKSTIARAVADALGFLYVDTGAMYRAVTLAARERGVDLEDEDAMGEVARAVAIDFGGDGRTILLDGRDVSPNIRTPELTAVVRYAARAAPVRAEMVARQQALADRRPVVMEGRDITTVVLPRARWKFLLTASAEERARRRFDEFRAAGHEVEYDSILAEVRDRDESDRAVGPLKAAMERASATGDIRLLDTTDLSAAQVVERVVSVVRDEKETDPA